MSIEYRAVLPTRPQAEVVARIIETISQHPAVAVVASDDATVRLRFAHREPRQKWPEDMTVTMRGDKVDVAFDSATRDERRAFLALLSTVLGSYGIAAAFEEV